MADLTIKPQAGSSNKLILQDQQGGAILTSGKSGAEMNTHVIPASDAALNLGSSAKRWNNIYTTDLHLANERGNWTVIEEENYLTLRNNKTDKVYKLVMEEIE